MSYDLRVYVERYHPIEKKWQYIGQRFLSDSGILMKYFSSRRGNARIPIKRERGIPEDISGYTAQIAYLDEATDVLCIAGEDIVELIAEHYKRHPIRKLVKRSNVERELDLLRVILDNDAYKQRCIFVTSY